MWLNKFSTGPTPVWTYCARMPRKASIAKRPLLISFNLSYAVVFSSLAQPNLSNKPFG